MSLIIPAAAAATPLAELLAQHLPLLHRGKVRDTFGLPDHDENVLVLASDRLSIFDFVLPTLVPDKGAVLTAMSRHWFTRLSRFGIRHHLVASGAKIDSFLPEALRGSSQLQRQAIVVRRLKMVPVECIVRGYLTGSGFKAYQKTGEVCGFKLPSGLHDGSKLSSALFTPTTKATEGHDEHLDHAAVVLQYGQELETLSLRIYLTLQVDAEQAGIVLADTKFEFGHDEEDQGEDRLVLADEVGTPDSSRFWDAEQLGVAAAAKRSPSGFDKEPVRQWGTTVVTSRGIGLDALDPAEPHHVRWVKEELSVPPEVVAATTERYLTIFRRLTGYSLPDYQRAIMGIF